MAARCFFLHLRRPKTNIIWCCRCRCSRQHQRRRRRRRLASLLLLLLLLPLCDTFATHRSLLESRCRIPMPHIAVGWQMWAEQSRAEKPSILINVSSGRNHKEKQYENLSKQRACACVCLCLCGVCVVCLCVPLIMILECCSNECANIQFNWLRVDTVRVCVCVCALGLFFDTHIIPTQTHTHSLTQTRTDMHCILMFDPLHS